MILTVEPIETIILTFGTLVNASTETTDVTLNLISDDNPNVSALDYSKTEFAEHESFTITATLDAAHSKESIIPLTVTGTADLSLIILMILIQKKVFSIFATDLNKPVQYDIGFAR